MEFLEGITPREYQEKIFETCVDFNCLVVLPTGLGKTLIALMLTIDRMKRYPSEKVLFLAPTKPLAEQHLKSFKRYLPELFGQIDLFTGAVSAKEREKIWQNSDIIFSTPQCIANDLKSNLYNLGDVSLLVEDEAHRCIKNYDYNYIAQMYMKQAENKRIIGMTASPGSEESKIKEICKNLSIEKVEIRTRDSEDVVKYLQDLNFKRVDVELPDEFGEMRRAINSLLNQYIEELRFRRVLFKPATKTNLILLQKEISGVLSRGNRNFNYMLGASACAQAIKLQHALELLETQTLFGFNKYLENLIKQARNKQSKGVVKLVAKSEFNFIYLNSCELLSNEIEHPKIEGMINLIRKERQKGKIKIIVFTQFRDTAKILSNKLNELDGIRSEIFVGQLKKDGMGLSQKEQKKIIEDFSSGEINVLCATQIAEEGLDIPEVNAVIFYEPVASAIRSIQRMGRTARLMPGKAIIFVTKKTRDETYFYVSKRRESKMQKAISNVKRDLMNPDRGFQKNL